MKNYYTLKSSLIGMCVLMFICFQTSVYAQISLTASGGTATGSYTTISDAFTAINAGTHTGSIAISVNGNTTEPAAPTYLAASGQLSASFTDLTIKPTVVATISGETAAGSAVINIDGADFVTIDGSITVGGTTRDLTIQNTAANTISNTACIRLVGRTTLGLGATDISISNCILTGSTTGNNGSSGSTVTSSYGIYAGSDLATSMGSTSGGADYDNLLIQNNLVTNAYIGINIIGLSANATDNLLITGNTVGSLAARIGYKGIAVQNAVGGSATNNTVTAIEVTTSLNIAGIEVGGTASDGFEIRRNTISDIHSFSTGGWGAYGINVASGVNYVISNNVIHGVQTLNYSNSTTYNAFGIRIAGGTGHKIYYNSVNMYGAYSTGSATNAFSAAFLVTTTAATGLDIRNNVFANKMTSTASNSVEFLAVCFPSSYNFLNATLDRNAYFVTADAQHHIGKIGTTSGGSNYSTLNAWRAISQVNNATNDVESHPANSNSNAPFTSDSDLTVPVGTTTVMESLGLPIASLVLPNVDRNDVARPAGTGTNPDLGAYEFEGITPADLDPPVVSGVSVAPGASCTPVPHTVTATVTDNVGATTVTLSYSYDGAAQTPITMTLASGTAMNGTYTADIPAAVGSNVSVTYSVQATDALANVSTSVSGTPYADEYLIVTASADQAIFTSVGTTVSATTNTPAFSRLLITEIIQYKNGTGDGTYPAYIPTADNDFVEISNYGDVDADASGFTLSIYGGVNGSFTIPANTIIPSGSTLVLAFSGTATDAANLYYGMNLGGTTSSGVACGYVLTSPIGTITDAIATNSYVFTAASGVTGTDWTGTIASTSGLAGVRRTVATDNNNATDWTLSSATNLTNIGVYNTEITIDPIPQTIVWTNSFNATTSMTNPLTVAPFATPGVYTYTATFNDGTCTSSDDVVITVTTPVPPIASFSATPVAGSAPLNVTFTDMSANIPDAWAWTIAPMTGVTYTTGTATSQNPVVEFANAGTYTITLLASNIAGSDDTTIVQYITVDYCTSEANNGGDSDIGNVTFGAINNGTATPVFSNATAVETYSDFTALPVETFGVGQSYPIEVSQITSGATFYNAHVNVFIDYNNDGAFDPTTERAFSAPTSSTGPISTVSGSVAIPAAAVLGTVRMRVILQEGGTATSDPCGNYGYGETEDYFINLECSSVAPTAATDAICSGLTSTLTATGNAVQWYADATTSTVLATGATYTTPALTATTSYFATGSDVGCVESARTEFIVTVNQPTSSTETVAECVDYTWAVDGMTYNTTGMYTAVIPNAAGCDSTITLDLTISGATSGTDVLTECDSYTWIDGVTYTANNNTATFMTQTTAGCDSLVSLDLTIVNSSSSTEVASSCGDYVWVVDGMTYSATGMYTAVLPNTAGCDSTITLDLTVNNATSSSTTVSTCGDYVWDADGMTYSTAGTYTATLMNSNGCDSVATLILTISSVSNIGVTPSAGTLTADLLLGPGVSMNWLDCDNGYAAIPGASGQSYSPAVNGNYAVRITENGCVDTSACYLITDAGLDNFNLAKMSIVPNPTNNVVTISFEASEARLTILDLNGKIMEELTVKSGDSVDMSAFENGVYLFSLYTDSIRSIERVVKQ